MLGGRYEVLSALGTGGQGIVGRARDHQQGRDVALKIRPVHEGVDRDRVLDEARLLLSVPPHPNIALARDDFFEGDDHVLVMDFVDGPSLADRIESDEALSNDDVMRWLGDVAAALDHLHSQQPPVIHGDVKPANVVLHTDAERAVLVDFGLAGLEGSCRRSAATAGFAAPEVTSGDVGPGSDIYGLAATAHALLAGGPPAPGSASGLAPAPRAVLSSGLALRPESRPASASRFVRELAAALGVQAPESEARPRRGLAKRSQWLAALAASVIAAIAVTFAATRPTGDTGDTGDKASVASGTTLAPSIMVPGDVRAAPVTVADAPAPKGAARTTVVTQRATPTATPVGRVGFFRDGALEVHRVLASGALENQRATPIGDRLTAVVRITDGFLFAYRRDDGFNRLLTVNPDGLVVEGRINPDVGDGWSHVVGLDHRLLFFYRQSDGFAATHRYSDRGNLADGDSYIDQSVALAGYDRVVHAGDNRVLLYATQTGRSALLTIGEFGELTIVGRPQLAAGWTLLAPTGTGAVLGLRPGSPARVLRASGSVVSVVGEIDLGPGAWSAAAACRDGVIVHDGQNGNALLARVTANGASSVVSRFTIPGTAVMTNID